MWERNRGDENSEAGHFAQCPHRRVSASSGTEISAQGTLWQKL